MLVSPRFALAIANARDAGGTASGLRSLCLGARVPTAHGSFRRAHRPCANHAACVAQLSIDTGTSTWTPVPGGARTPGSARARGVLVVRHVGVAGVLVLRHEGVASHKRSE